MSDTIPTRYGSCIWLELIYRDGEAALEDVSGDSFEIRDAVPASLAEDMAITPIDPANGKIGLALESEGAKKLKLGRVNHFRLCRIGASGCEDNANLLWIEVE